MYFEEIMLDRRFQPIFLKETSLEDTLKYYKKLNLTGKHHNLRIEEALKVAVTLSDRYVTDRYLPDKAIDLLMKLQPQKDY